MFFDYFNRTVRAAAVHDDVFKVGITLTEHRLDTFFQVLGLIVGGGDDGDGGDAHVFNFP